MKPLEPKTQESEWLLEFAVRSSSVNSLWGARLFRGISVIFLSIFKDSRVSLLARAHHGLDDDYIFQVEEIIKLLENFKDSYIKWMNEWMNETEIKNTLLFFAERVDTILDQKKKKSNRWGNFSVYRLNRW